MQTKKYRISVALMSLVLWLGMIVSPLGAPLVPDGTIEEHLRGDRLAATADTREKTLPASEHRANFTHFSGVKDVEVIDGVLSFTTTREQATLGWGNYRAQQSPLEVVDMWDFRNDVVLRVRQSATNSIWKMRVWADGNRIRGAEREATLVGDEWLDFSIPDATVRRPTPDGLEFEIKSEPGTRFEIESAKLIQPFSKSCFRKEFILPEGKIWSAVADVSGWQEEGMFTARSAPNRNRLSVNGRAVERRGPIHAARTTAPVDLAPYLQSGTNVLGLLISRTGATAPASGYLQLTVVMESGEVIRVVTDNTWKTTALETDGWDEPGFDDSDWTKAQVHAGPPRNTSRNPLNFDWDETQFAEYPLAAYAGRMIIVNPDAHTLYYTAGKPINLDIHLPPGLKDKSPAIQYQLARVDEEGASVPFLDGDAQEWEEKDGSLVFPVRIAPQPESGVYAIAMVLLLNGQPAETREREPLIVMDMAPAPVIKGEGPLEGFELELERIIDFTDPDDPHPWFESAYPGDRTSPWIRIEEPRIIKKDGLKYREVNSNGPNSFFSYRLGEFKHPGDLYLFEVEYPDDAERDFHVCIVSKGLQPNVQAGTGVGTGGKAMLTHEMQTYYWVMVPDSGVYSLDVISHYGVGKTEGRPAAARSVKIYHVKGKLPSIGAGDGRRFGVNMERCHFSSGHGVNFGMWPWTKEMRERTMGYSARQRQLKNLVFLEQLARVYTDYLGYAGQNTHLIGCYQYSEMNTPYTRADEVSSSRVIPCLKNVLAHYMDARGMSFMANVIFMRFDQIATSANNAQVARGRDTIYTISADGSQRSGLNMTHPTVRERFNRFIGDFGRTFGHLENFKGVYFWLWPTRFLDPAAGSQWDRDYSTYLDNTYDDHSFAAFREWADVELPVDKRDPERFRKRRELLDNNEALLEKYLVWRSQGYVQGLAELGLDALRATRPDLEFLAPIYARTDFYKAWTESGMPFSEFTGQFGLDSESFNATEGLGMGMISTAWSPWFFLDWKTPYHRSPYHWIPRVEQEVAGLFMTGPTRFMQMFNNQSESTHDSPEIDQARRGWGGNLVESDWILDRYKIRANSQMGGVWAREPFIQALIASDVNHLYFGWSDVNLPIGHEHELRSFARVFTHLPPERFIIDLDTGLDSNFAIRHLTRGDETICYVANPGFWTVKGCIRVETDGTIKDLVTGMPVEAKREGETICLPVELEGFGLTAFRVSSGNWKVLGFEVDPVNAAAVGYIESILTEVHGYISNPVIVEALSPDDLDYLTAAVTDAKAALEKGEVARAWQRVTHWRFWVLLQDYLKPSAGEVALLPADLPVQIIQTTASGPALNVAKADQAPVIDGRLDDPVWRAGAFTTGFVDADGRTAPAPTAVRFTLDDEMLYIGIVCADRDTNEVQVNAGDRSGLFGSQASDDAVYIHIQPDGNMPVHYMIAFNTAGIRAERREYGSERDYSWQSQAEIATDKREGYWSAEVALPLANMQSDDTPADAEWRAQVVRFYRGNRLPPSSLGRISGHWYTPQPVDFFRLHEI